VEALISGLGTGARSQRVSTNSLLVSDVVQPHTLTEAIRGAGHLEKKECQGLWTEEIMAPEMPWKCLGCWRGNSCNWLLAVDLLGAPGPVPLSQGSRPHRYA
jgi:hypothetical protein